MRVDSANLRLGLRTALAASLITVACAGQQRSPSMRFVLTQMNGHPLPYVEYGSKADTVNRIEQGFLERFKDSIRFTTTNRPTYLAHFPCEGLRMFRAPVDSSAGGATLVQVRDTSTAGCDELRIQLYTTVFRYQAVGDSLYLRDSSGTELHALMRGDTILIVNAAPPGDSRRAVYVRQ